MSRKLSKLILLICLVAGGFTLSRLPRAYADESAQIPTGSVPTVTGTPAGAIAVVLDNEQGYANVRSGPATIGYEVVGVLIPGQRVPALGRSSGGAWVQIAYPGIPGGVAWVFADLVRVEGSVPVVEPPPTPTPRTTPTLDPTLAAQFLVEVEPTRQPTYTQPPPINYPTFSVETANNGQGRVPMGLLIIGMGVVGLFGALISFLRGR